MIILNRNDEVMQIQSLVSPRYEQGLRALWHRKLSECLEACSKFLQELNDYMPFGIFPFSQDIFAQC
jgi:hypothetical protein